MGREITVCVVDDDVEAATVLCEGLKLHEFNAVQVHSGQEALEVCARQPIDLVLLDVMMPGMDGYEVCQRLKENPETLDIPVIFVTVKGGADDVKRGYQLGAVDYITKPYNLPMVMLRVESALAKYMDTLDAAYTDELTGLRNRRFLLERLQEEIDKAHRYNFPVSCLLIDVDDVVALDDEVGPVSMDDLLAEAAMSMRSFTRAHDVLARYDGTLFAALLPHTPLSDAMGYAAKILNDFDATTFSDPNMPTRATVSVGIVSCQNGSATGADAILGETMRSLLKAKGLSQQRICGKDLAET